MNRPALLLLAEAPSLPALHPLRQELAAVGVEVRIPQEETRIGRSWPAVLDSLLETSSVGLVAGPDGDFTRAAYHAFRAKLVGGRRVQLYLKPSGRHAYPDFVYGFAVVLQPRIPDRQLARLLRTALDTCADLSTLRGPSVDSLNGPFVSSESWVVAFAGGAWPTDGNARGYEESRGIYWGGLYRTGYLEELPQRFAASRALLRQAEQAGDPLGCSLILSKGLAYGHMISGRRDRAMRDLKAAGAAAAAARDPRARCYVLEYAADVASLDGRPRKALDLYAEAAGSLRGVELREVQLKSELAACVAGEVSPTQRLGQLLGLRDSFDQLVNYRTGVVDILLGRELAAAGLRDEALAILLKAEAFFSDILPMPRNRKRAAEHRKAVEDGFPTGALALPW